MLIIAGVAISLFLSVLLLSKRQKQTADYILAIWLVVIACHLYLYNLLPSGDYLKAPHLIGIEKVLAIAHGPFIYLYTRTSTTPCALGFRWLVHALPTLAAIGALWPFWGLTGPEKLAVYASGGKGYEGLLTVLVWGAILSGVFYCGWAQLLLWRHRSRNKTQFSDTSKVDLRWIQHLIFGLLGLWVLVMVGEDPLIFGGVVCYVLYIGYFGIRQTNVFASMGVPLPPPEVVESSTEDAPGTANAHKPSGLEAERLADTFDRLTQLMTATELYRMPELTLATVAAQMGVHPHTLSEVINRSTGQHFFDYINTWRVQAFKARIAHSDYKPYTLLAAVIHLLSFIGA